MPAERVSKINILAYDPVPGISPMLPIATVFTLPAKVNQFIGIYARDERSFMFEPVIPTRESPSTTKMWVVAVPGSHETMMGNFQFYGHSPNILDPFGYLDHVTVPCMHPVNSVAKAVALRLLTSWEWGEVPFGPFEPQPPDNEADFLAALSAMYDCDYGYIRTAAFPTFWSTYNHCYNRSVTSADHNLRTISLVPVEHGRLCFVAPNFPQEEWYRSWCWPLWPIHVNRPEWVYWLDTQVRSMNATAWTTLQSLRGSPPPDSTPPEPSVAVLPVIKGECSATITSPPTASDDVSGTVIGTTTDPLTYTEEGTYTVTWTYRDASGNQSTQTQTVEVDDITPPTPDIDPLPTVQEQCSTQILTVPTATDGCSGIITATTGDPLVYHEQGTHTVTWTYNDGRGNVATQTQTVIVKDTTPPTVTSASVSRATLWPPNHAMVPVTVTAAASDNCDGAVTCKIASVSSNEPENGLGDGDTAPDWEVTGNLTVNLRSERSGTGSGRIYTIAITCMDSAGNQSTAKNVTVSVPRDDRH